MLKERKLDTEEEFEKALSKALEELYLSLLLEFNQELFKVFVECECGAEKVKTTHSDWCPKYKK